MSQVKPGLPESGWKAYHSLSTSNIVYPSLGTNVLYAILKFAIITPLLAQLLVTEAVLENMKEIMMNKLYMHTAQMAIIS